MTATRNVSGLRRGWAWMRVNRREGRRQRGIRRLFVALDGATVSTADLLQVAYPRLDTRKRIPDWQSAAVRRSAVRYGERILQPRSRPLKWRPKADLLVTNR